MFFTRGGMPFGMSGMNGGPNQGPVDTSLYEALRVSPNASDDEIKRVNLSSLKGGETRLWEICPKSLFDFFFQKSLSRGKNNAKNRFFTFSRRKNPSLTVYMENMVFRG